MAKSKTDIPNMTEEIQITYAQLHTQGIVDAALAAGAQSIILDISDTIDGVEFTIEVGEITSFELLGGKRTYQDMQISSAADSTILKELTIKSGNNIPLKISSNNLTLEVVNVESKGYALLLSGNDPCITLIRDNYLTATSGDAIVCKVPEIISKTVNKAIGTIQISGNMYVNGITEDVAELEASAYLDVENGEIILISDELYAQYIKGAFYINFNANCGTVEESTRMVFCGSAIGSLPIPVRTGYDFVGWFTEDGTQVTESTSFTSANDVALIAKWSAMAYSVSWKTSIGYTIAVSRTSSPYANANIGTLNNGDVIYYGDVLSITYTNQAGYSIYCHGKNNITVTGNVDSSSIYAQALTGWVKASDMPAGSQVVNTKWTYTLREYTSNSSSSLSGWTHYETIRTDWTDWSGWLTWNPDNGVRDVQWQSAYDHTEYHYYRWTNSGHNAIYTYRTNEYNCTILEEAWFTYVLPTSSKGIPIVYNGTDNWPNRWVPANSSYNNSTDKTFTRDIYRDEWRYRDPIYTYYFYRDIPMESASNPTGQENVLNVVEWAQYIVY